MSSGCSRRGPGFSSSTAAHNHQWFPLRGAQRPLLISGTCEPGTHTVHKHTDKTYTKSKINTLKINYCQIQPNSLILFWPLNDHRNNFLTLQNSVWSLPETAQQRKVLAASPPDTNSTSCPLPSTAQTKCRSGHWLLSGQRSVLPDLTTSVQCPVPTWLKRGNNSPKLSSHLHIHTVACTHTHTYIHK